MTQTPRPPADFDGIPVARQLLRTIRSGALATLDKEAGFPFASLVTVATDLDGAPLLLMSRLAAHAGNLEADPRASILLAQGGKGDPLAHPRLTVIGRVERTAEPRVRSRFLARHPKAALYADFGDFSFWRMDIAGGHLNGGFARAMTLSPEQIRTELAGAEELVAVEDSAVAHMNEDHREALALYATRLGRDRPRRRRPDRQGRIRPARGEWWRAAQDPARHGAAGPQHPLVTMTKNIDEGRPGPVETKA
jgi:putative heme iron utilization protein